MPKRSPQRPRPHVHRPIQLLIREPLGKPHDLFPRPVVVNKQRPVDVESADDLNPTSRPDKRYPPAPGRPHAAGVDIPDPRIPRGSRRLGAIPPKMGLFRKNAIRDLIAPLSPGEYVIRGGSPEAMPTGAKRADSPW